MKCFNGVGPEFKESVKVERRKKRSERLVASLCRLHGAAEKVDSLFCPLTASLLTPHLLTTPTSHVLGGTMLGISTPAL